MKKETIIWQIIVLVLGFFLIFVIRAYLENKIVVDAMKVKGEVMSNRGNCYLLTEEKNLIGDNCKNIDISPYAPFEKILGR
ncbi:MAG: hypothetical protein WC609_04110 [Candidatus Paceibacterota bacterium]|jgi:hypothetical protein